MKISAHLVALAACALPALAATQVVVEKTGDIPEPAYCQSQDEAACDRWSPLKSAYVDWQYFTFIEDDPELEATCERWKIGCFALSGLKEYAFIYGCEQEPGKNIIRAFCSGFRSPASGRKPRSHTGSVGFSSGTIQLKAGDGNCQPIQDGFCQAPFSKDHDFA